MQKRIKNFTLFIITALMVCSLSIILTACDKGWGEWKITKNPTCTEPGEMIRYDLQDSEKFEVKEIPANGHIYADGDGWKIETPPTHTSEGVEKRICAVCGNTEYRDVPALTSAYIITVKDGDKVIDRIYVDDDGEYEITAPTKLGYDFDGFYDNDGDFATSGTISESKTVFTRWNVRPTTTFDELKERAGAGVEKILIDADITLTDTVYIVSKTEIYVTQNRTVKRAPAFKGDMFVIGENEKGENVLLSGNRAELTLKTEDGATLTFDGNKSETDNVSGTAFMVLNSSLVKMYDGVKVVNCKKSANSKVVEGKYNVSYPHKIGGAGMIIVNGTFDMYGGSFENNEVNQDETNLGDDESEELRESSCGGAIYNYASLNIYGGTFSDNKASRGGAIYNYRSTRVYKGSFESNYAGVYGGAIYLPGSQYSLLYMGNPDAETADNSIVFNANSSEKSGGALFGQMKNSIVSYGGTVFSNNVAIGNNGGAINTSGALVLNSATFTDNTAASKGGAVYAYYSNPELTTRQVEINGGKFEGNRASKGGAVAFSASQAEFSHGSIGEISGAIFKNNLAYATETSDPELPDESEDDETSTSKNYNGNGGAIYISRKSTVTINSNTVFENNESERKGGAIYVTISELNIDGATFTSNTSGGNGGAIYCYTDANTNIKNAKFNTNITASTAQGGGALYFTGATATIDTCEFVGNKATVMNGGAVGIYSESNISILKTSFTGNESASVKNGGGGVYVSGSTVKLDTCSFTENKATGFNGGAMGIYSEANVTIKDTTFTKNEANGTGEAKGGGAVYISGSTVEFINGTFTENKATTMNGGAVCVYSKANVSFSGISTFSGNTSKKNGGALYATSNGTVINLGGNSNFTNNIATGNGGALYVTSKAKLDAENMCATGNSAKTGGCMYVTSGGTVVTVYAGELKDNIATSGHALADGNAADAVLNLKAGVKFNGTYNTSGKLTVNIETLTE